MSKREYKGQLKGFSGRRQIASGDRKGLLWRGAVLMVLAVCVYLPALRCGFIWDDDSYVQENEALRSLKGLGQIWFDVEATPQYYPLVHTTFWIEYHLWGFNAGGYHFVNILLHGCSAWVLWRLLCRLGVPGAWVIGALFAVHPIEIESVAWVTERKNVLSGLCYLLAASAYVRYALRAEGDGGASGNLKWYFASLALFAAALLSKTVSSTLPAVLLVILWWQGERIGIRRLAELAPMFVLGAAFGMLTVWLEKYHVKADGDAWQLTVGQHVVLAGQILSFYVLKLLWPVPLIFFYPRWSVEAGNWTAWLYPAGVVIILVLLYLYRRRVGRGPLTAVLCYILTLFPALGFFNVYPMRYSWVADHFQYMAGIGVMGGIVAIGFWGGNRFSRLKVPLGIAATIWIGVLGVMTWQRCQVYEHIEELWRDTIAKNPEAWMAYNNLGNVQLTQNRLDEAESSFRSALRIKPDHGKAYINLAGVYRKQKQYDKAAEAIRRGIELEPDLAGARWVYASILIAQNKLGEAEVELIKAIQLKPDFIQARDSYAYVLHQQGRDDEAMGQLTEMLRYDPKRVNAMSILAEHYRGLGQNETALQWYNRILECEPNNPLAMQGISQIRARQPVAPPRSK